MIPFRLLAFGLLGFVMMLATGCAGRTATAQPQGVSEARPVADQTPPPVPSAPQDTETAPDDLLDPFAGADEVAGEEYDPWEPVNVYVFEFNRQFDRFLLKPVAQGYNFLMPDWVQLSVSNFIYNIRFPQRFLNNVFQGKFKGAGIEVGRLVVNSTLGVGGAHRRGQGYGLADARRGYGANTWVLWGQAGALSGVAADAALYPEGRHRLRSSTSSRTRSTGWSLRSSRSTASPPSFPRRMIGRSP